VTGYPIAQLRFTKTRSSWPVSGQPRERVFPVRGHRVGCRRDSSADRGETDVEKMVPMSLPGEPPSSLGRVRRVPTHARDRIPGASTVVLLVRVW